MHANERARAGEEGDEEYEGESEEAQAYTLFLISQVES